MGVNFKQLCFYSAQSIRTYAGVASETNKYNCKLLVVGGGAGGCSVAWRFAKTLNPKDIIVLEPSETHYYQPHFTLVSAGIKQFKESHRPTASVLPPNVTWLQDAADSFQPNNNEVYTTSGHKVTYDFMVVALGMKNDYDQIVGLKDALEHPLSPVCTIYAPPYCRKTWLLIKEFSGGLALFTRPRQVGKCSGAAHCITYLAEHYWRKRKVRERTSIMFTSGDEVIYGVGKYAAALSRVAAARGVALNCGLQLVEVLAKGAVFEDSTGRTLTLPYNLLHVTPPMSPPKCLSKCEELATQSGYLDVDQWTLRHKNYENVFGIGDCLCTPNSKSAAAVAQQSVVVARNLSSVMQGKPPIARYNGYGACPIVTSYGTGMLAEFLYDKRVWETFPFDQSQERRFLYYLKKDIAPYLYWNKLIKGKWNGPGTLRKIINPLGR